MAMSLLWRRQAAGKDVPVQLPLAGRLLPNDDVLALIEYLASLTRKGVPSDLEGCIAVPLHFGSLDLDRLDAHVHQTLKERLERLRAHYEIAVGRHELPRLRIEGRNTGRITPGSHKCFVRCHNGIVDRS